jgi:hypothetical protein
MSPFAERSLALLAACSCTTSEARPAKPTRGSLARATATEIVTPSTLELSGIVWAPTLDRFLVVSDDVTDEAGHKHAPRVFALSASGELDTEAIQIAGVDELNDLESICAGPGGSFFVTTSHSANKRGRIPASRRKLLHLALSGRTLRILGQGDLTEARPGEALDVEALAWRADGLYIGLKAPLGADGSATILRMPDPVATLGAGTIAATAVESWRHPRLCLAKGTCEGISDLAFSPDGSVLLLGNSPKGATGDGGGALWRMADADSPPVLLRQFPGLKPEGISVSADGSSVTIVFDRDRRQPMWLSWRLGP